MYRCAYTYVSPNGFSSKIYNFIVTATMGRRELECSIIDNLLISDQVPLNVRLDIMFITCLKGTIVKG